MLTDYTSWKIQNDRCLTNFVKCPIKMEVERTYVLRINVVSGVMVSLVFELAKVSFVLVLELA